ncbi:MAG TPA: hypothetical protein G4O01_03075 [Dehalococcoidia bacterium]|jgi:hypothetical protein|nr:hypothetical protein [Dehalococcoidia bacterium]
MKPIKLSRTGWLILTFGLFIIMLAGLGVVRFQQVSQQEALKEKLELVQTKLARIQTEKLSQRQKELEQELSQTLAEAQAAKEILSQPLNSLAISDLLWATAQASGVEIAELSSPGMSTAELEGVPCSVLSLTTRVEGELTGLVDFITGLNDALVSGVVKSAQINIPPPGEAKPSASIELAVYSYQGE